MQSIIYTCTRIPPYLYITQYLKKSALAAPIAGCIFLYALYISLENSFCINISISSSSHNSKCISGFSRWLLASTERVSGESSDRSLLRIISISVYIVYTSSRNKVEIYC